MRARAESPACPRHLTDMGKVPFLDYREVLVTGGTGFLGKAVCRALIAQGYLPRLLVRIGSEGAIPDDIRGASRVTPGDITNRESVENAAQSTNAIVHLAGIIREVPGKDVTFEKVHEEGTRNAVHAAKLWRIPRFVHVSALGAAPGNTGGYFDSKGRAEEIVRQSGLAWTIFRPSGIFGPGDRFIGELVRALRKAPVLPVPGDGEFFLQPVFVGDVVKGIVDSLARPDTETTAFDVGGPERFTFNELVDRIAAAAGVRAREVPVPLPRIPRGARFFSRREKFPLSADMLEMLLAGHTCDDGPYYSAFGLTPLPLSGYLAHSKEAGDAGGGGLFPGDAGTSPGMGEKNSRSSTAA